MTTTDAPLVVTGFHRSGTSAAARLLSAAGLDLGRRLVGRRRSNPHGHFEDASVVALHDTALAAAGRAWDSAEPSQVGADEAVLDRMRAIADGRSSPWGFKDPRACFFLDSWSAVAGGVRVVAMYRSPRDAAASLLQREARRIRSGHGELTVARRLWSDPASALRSWIAYNRVILEFADRNPGSVMAMSFDTLGAGAPLVERVEERWRLGLRPTATFARVDPRWPGTDGHGLRSLDAGTLQAELDQVGAALTALETGTVVAGA
jgi:hypothetical protein